MQTMGTFRPRGAEREFRSGRAFLEARTSFLLLIRRTLLLELYGSKTQLPPQGISPCLSFWRLLEFENDATTVKG